MDTDKCFGIYNSYIVSGWSHCGSWYWRLKLHLLKVSPICFVLLFKGSSFDRSSLKREARRLFRKFCPSPISWEPFNARAPSRTVIGYYRHSMGTCAVRRTTLWLRLWFYIIQGFTNALWKSSVSMAQCGMNLFYCHLSFYTGKRRYECCARL
jgi:hypothetical protein